MTLYPQKTKQINQLLFKPVDPSSLAVFRFIFGIALCWFVYYQLTSFGVFKKYIEPKFFFTFPLFDFLGLKPLSANGIYTLFKCMGVSAACIALGIFYRFALVGFLLTFGYIFLLEKTFFNNHYYLFLLLAFLLVFMGANRWASIDALRKPQLVKQYIPFWQIFLLRAQICIVYFYAGIVKVNLDYLAGRHMRIWLIQENLLPFLQPWIASDWAINIFVFASVFIDLTIGFFLCFRQTRMPAILVAALFHIVNQLMFHIGVFHMFMIGALILFVEPEEPKRLWQWILQFFRKDHVSPPPSEYKPPSDKKRGFVLSCLGVYLFIQILLPFRHFLYKSNVNWTKEGQRFSWRLKANIRAGIMSIMVVDSETGERISVIPFEDLTPDQYVVMSYTPDMILQYVHFLKDKYQKQGVKNPIIKVDGQLSLNGRPYLPYINKDINLAEKEYKLFQEADWILPAPDDL